MSEKILNEKHLWWRIKRQTVKQLVEESTMSNRILNEKRPRWRIGGDKEIEKIIKVKRTSLCLYFWLAFDWSEFFEETYFPFYFIVSTFEYNLKVCFIMMEI